MGMGGCGQFLSEQRSGDRWTGWFLLRQQLLIISQLVDADGCQLFVQLQLRLRQLGQINHHQEVLEENQMYY